MVRPGGKLAVTTWGPRMFEPAYSRWLASVKRERPDLHSAFNPWDCITDVEAVRRLLRDGGVTEADIIAEDGLQPLRSAEDWWDNRKWIGASVDDRADGTGGRSAGKGG